MILNAKDIMLAAEAGMIKPFEQAQVTELTNGSGALSYGLGGFGYDCRLAPRGLYVLTKLEGQCQTVDPKNFSELAIHTVTLTSSTYGDYYVLPRLTTGLGVTIERFSIPLDVLVLLGGKSTYARCGVSCAMTPGEPGWIGHLTIEVFNGSPNPVRLYANEGIVQAVFFRGEPTREYTGRYQNQEFAPVVARG